MVKLHLPVDVFTLLNSFFLGTGFDLLCALALDFGCDCVGFHFNHPERSAPVSAPTMNVLRESNTLTGLDSHLLNQLIWNLHFITKFSCNNAAKACNKF